jgi:hypothetical protein
VARQSMRVERIGGEVECGGGHHAEGTGRW